MVGGLSFFAVITGVITSALRRPRAQARPTRERRRSGDRAARPDERRGRGDARGARPVTARPGRRRLSRVTSSGCRPRARRCGGAAASASSARARARSAEIRTTAEVSGAARISPTAPNSAPPRDRHDQHRERVDAERRAHRERLHQLLEDRRWRAAGRRSSRPPRRCPAPPSAIRTANAAGGPGAEVGDVGADEGDDGDRADQRHAEDQRADRDHHRVERGDDRHPEEVAAQRRRASAG